MKSNDAPFCHPPKFRFLSHWTHAVTSSQPDPDCCSRQQDSFPLSMANVFTLRRVALKIVLACAWLMFQSDHANAQTAFPPPSSYGTTPSLQNGSTFQGQPDQGAPAYGNSVYGGPSNNGAPGQFGGSGTVPPPPNSTGQFNGQPSFPGQTVAPNQFQGGQFQGGTFQGGTLPGPLSDTFPSSPNLPPPVVPQPTVREADLIIQGYPARTGRLMFGGAVNSDAGVTGQITIDERNFDISRWPRSFGDLFSGTAFRGAGQTFRVEAAPGTDFQRYTAQFADPNLLGYLPISMSLSGFLFDRRFQDWDENRMGGRASFGYRVTPDLSVSLGLSGQNVDITRPRVNSVQRLNDVLGDNGLFSGFASLIHDTRNSPLQPSQGHYFELSFEQTFGDYDFSTFEAEYRKYFLLRERADGSGKQTLSYSLQLGFSGEETPVFENYFAGGYATLRGFDFRGAGPVENGVQVGGRFQFLNSVEYMFPLTADDAFRGVAFVDFGTVEQDIEINGDNFRVVPGFGFRVAIPMLGPAPLAFDFGFPVLMADTDDERLFSFYMSAVR